MKKITFYAALLIPFYITAQVRIVNVDPVNNKITLKNFSATAEDITGYRLCALFSYQTISAGIIDTGDLNLSQNEEVVLTWTITETASDLGFYTPTGSFGSSTAMLDFVQWGSGGNGRESVAVAKGIWSAGDFITLGSPYSYTGDGSQNGVTFWDNTLGIEDNVINGLKIYPNPAKNELNIFLNALNTEVSIEVFDLTGKKLYASTLTAIKTSISVSNWRSGVYLVQLSNDTEVKTMRFIKQ